MEKVVAAASSRCAAMMSTGSAVNSICGMASPSYSSLLTATVSMPGIFAAVQIARASCGSFLLPDRKGRTALAGNGQGSWPSWRPAGKSADRADRS